MKPDWNDAPEWANYLAMDEDGSWYFYAEKPVTGIAQWVSDAKYLKNDPSNEEDWRKTLEDRPS